MNYVKIILVLMCSQNVFAQIPEPPVSPESRLIQQVGDANFEIHYSRPAARGRKIFGGLVPYGKIWRTGAGKSSTISFDREVHIGGKSVAPGIYAFITIPGKDEWTIMLNSDTSKVYFEERDIDLKNEVVKLKATPVKSAYQESFTIGMDIINNNALIAIQWEEVTVKFAIETNTTKDMITKINQALINDPSDAKLKGQAASFFLRNSIQLERALTLVDEAFGTDKTWWYLEMKIQILFKLRRTKEAEEARAQAIQYIQQAKPQYWQEIIETLKTTGLEYRT